jgi:hypothetical protein
VTELLEGAQETLFVPLYGRATMTRQGGDLMDSFSGPDAAYAANPRFGRPPPAPARPRPPGSPTDSPPKFGLTAVLRHTTTQEVSTRQTRPSRSEQPVSPVVQRHDTLRHGHPGPAEPLPRVVRRGVDRRTEAAVDAGFLGPESDAMIATADQSDIGRT